jgi:ABC-type nitrate/sulfonate/bicarbonate transport system substrate-binding protein
LLVVGWLALFAAPARVVAQDRFKFPVGVGTKTLGTGLIWLAAKKGFFEEFTLDVQPILLRGTPVAVQALLGESLYVAMGSADAMASAAATPTRA